MMSEKRFKILVPFQRSRQQVLKDCETGKSATIDVYNDDIDYFVDLLNSLNDELEESSAFIIEQRKENRQLRKRVEKLQSILHIVECCDKDE